MSLYIAESDFEGQTKVAKDIYTKSGLQKYIDKFEVEYLQDLLGCTMYEEFATDFAIIGTEPTDPKFTAIWEKFCIDGQCQDIHRSEGMKSMLSLFIYWEYLRDQFAKNNIGGMQKNEQANSTALDSQGTNVYTNYNEALETYCEIQWYITNNPDAYDYDSYNGQYKEIISMF